MVPRVFLFALASLDMVAVLTLKSGFYLSEAENQSLMGRSSTVWWFNAQENSCRLEASKQV